jgi:hypothetical protein
MVKIDPKERTGLDYVLSEKGFNVLGLPRK